MSMEMTDLDLQLSTDNQNGCHVVTKFFFLLNFFFVIPLKPGIYIYRFSGSASLLSVFMSDPNRGFSGHLDFLIDLWLLA